MGDVELLIACAEKYIIENAKEKLEAIRKIKNYEYKAPAHCHELLKEYAPVYDKTSKKLDFVKVLDNFCRVLQNYRGKKIEINYSSYTYTGKDKCGNLILDTVQEYFSNNTIIPSQKPKGKKEKHSECYESYERCCDGLYQAFKDKEKFYIEDTNDKKNSTWYQYCKGIVDVYIRKNEAKGNGYIEEIWETCKELEFDYNKDFSKESEDFIEKTQEKIDQFKKKYTGIGNTMSYDFFKELYAKDLIKADTHVKNCFIKCLNVKNNDNIDEEILRICLKICSEKRKKLAYYTPYYIDKILWLCCTGNFYKDGITINNMTRNNFINYYKDYETA